MPGALPLISYASFSRTLTSVVSATPVTEGELFFRSGVELLDSKFNSSPRFSLIAPIAAAKSVGVVVGILARGWGRSMIEGRGTRVGARLKSYGVFLPTGVSCGGT